MMGRVTFRRPEVQERVAKSFVATSRNVRPGYRVKKIDARVFEEATGRDSGGGDGDFAPRLAATVPNAQASENVATLIATAEGEILHVVPGFWRADAFVKELDFAVRVRDAVAAAGTDVESRRKAAADCHRGRLEELRGDWTGDPQAYVALRAVHERLVREPLRAAESVDGVTDYAVNAPLYFSGKMERVRAGAERLRAAGGDPSAVMKELGDFDRGMKAGRCGRADAALDRALSLVEGK